MEGVGRDALVRGHELVWNHIFSFINSMSLKCAVELSIPDAIHSHGGSIALLDLVAALGLPPTKATSLHRLMRLLVHSGFFATRETGNGGDNATVYLLTEVSTHFRRDSPTDMTPFVLMELDPIKMNPFHCLSAWFRDSHDPSKTPIEMAHGEGMWDIAGRRPEFGRVFDGAMASDTWFVMRLVVENCKGSFEGLKSLVDVGGGNGVAACVVADAFPHVKCAVLELPHVIARSAKVENVEFVEGDMFERIPSADAILLKWILHGWSDEECVKILKRCKEVIPSKEDGGKVIIIETIVNLERNNYKTVEAQYYLLDLMLMVVFTGKERNERDLAKIFNVAGFSGYKVISLIGLRSVIEVYP